ncbi:MAG TPA: SRPBCC domain-containing protein [Dehalococcoidia bacterium]|nr:SRPBCC domain-containing protein [Dehalococcoidia bacterium]
METPDRIEREVLIAAPLVRVWDLISQPGWWIGDGDRSVLTVTGDGESYLVDHPQYGRFPLRLVASDPPRSIAFRWELGTPDQETRAGAATLVEFSLREAPGGTVLRVVESGFAATAEGQRAREGNVKGWEFQLEVARRDGEQVAA